MKNNLLKTIVVTALAFGTILTAHADDQVQSEKFTKVNTYTADIFTDVAQSEWYADSVGTAFELGFMRGTAEGVFSPNGEITLAEAITVASRVHDMYFENGTDFQVSEGGAWYDGYVAYAVANGMITEGAFTDYERPATRYEMAVIFASAVPAEFLTTKNAVDYVPDVSMEREGVEKLLSLYRAGVLMGKDEYGTFAPDNSILRAEAAAIIARVAIPDMRIEKALAVSAGSLYRVVEDTVLEVLKKAEDDRLVVANIGGYEITCAEMCSVYFDTYAKFTNAFGMSWTDSEELAALFGSYFINDLIFNASVFSTAASLGYTFAPEDFAKTVYAYTAILPEIVQNIGIEDPTTALITYYYYEGLTPYMYYFDACANEIATKLITDLYEDNTERAQKIYNQTFDALTKGDYIRAKHILLAFPENVGGSPITDEQKTEIRKKAEEVLAKAKAGEDFDTLVAAYGEDPGMVQTPTGYYFTKGEMVKPFEEASYALKENEISELVETEFGYHIILRLPYDKESICATDLYQNGVTDDFNSLLSENYQKASKTTSPDFDLYLEAISVECEKRYIEFYEEMYGALDEIPQ